MSGTPRPGQILLVGQKIRQIRKSRHLTQADLAGRIGVTQSDLSRMENGEYKVGLDTLFRILQVFELSMSRFFEEPAALPATPVPVADELLNVPSEREQLLVDWSELNEESRREVKEFIAFKKMQAETRRPRWKPEDEPAAPPSEPESLDSDGFTAGGSNAAPRTPGEVVAGFTAGGSNAAPRTPGEAIVELAPGGGAIAENEDIAR